MNLEKIQSAVSKYSFTAASQGDAVIVKNKKGQTVARVTASGVEQLYYGNKNLCGSLVRNDIVSALKIENESRPNAKAGPDYYAAIAKASEDLAKATKEFKPGHFQASPEAHAEYKRAIKKAEDDLYAAQKDEREKNAERTNAKAALVTAQHEMKVAEATCQPAVIETARRNYVAASQAWEGVRA